MKKILLLLIIPLLATGCFSEEPIGTVASGDGANLTVRVDAPAVQTREAIADGMIESLWLMVFSQNGTFLARYEGELTGGAGNYSDYTFRGIPFSNGADRILHFVANYDWSGFDDDEQLGNVESSILPRMNVEDGNVAYWQRVVLAGGISGDPGTTIALPGGTVHLLRNIAEVSVTNESANGSNGMSLTNVEFLISNRFDKGSVALYNYTDGVAENGFVQEAIGGAPVTNITVADFGTQPVYVYERENSTAREATCVIVRGYFQDGTTPNNSTYSYYKVDIASKEATELLDLKRNRKYHITINYVSNDGYTNLSDAVTGASSNNIEASVVVSESPSISDGINVLEVDATSFTYIAPNEPFTINYSYTSYNNGVGTVNNDQVQMVFHQDPDKPVLAGTPTIDNGANGTISGVTAATMPESGVYDATITISKGVLSRTIRLHLRPDMEFIIVSTDPADRIVEDAVGEPVGITFKFPNDVSSRLFPISVRIYSKTLTPTPDSGMAIEYGDGDFWYVYNAEYNVDQDNMQLPHTLRFVSNTARTEETVILAADRFHDAYVTFGPYNFLNAAYNPTPVTRRTGEPVDINFTIPADYWTDNEQCVINYNTTTLQPLVNNPSGLVTVSANNYQLTVPKPAGAGSVDVTACFQTVDRNSTISTILSAAGFRMTTITAQRGAFWDFVDAYMSPRQRFVTGNGTDMTVSFTLSEGSVSVSEPVTVRFNASYLVLRDANGLNITTTGGTNNANTVLNINGLTTVGPHTFTVRNSATNVNQDNRNRAKTFTADSFNQSENINPAANFINPRFMRLDGGNWNTTNAKPRNVSRNTDLRLYFQLPADCPLPATVTLNVGQNDRLVAVSNNGQPSYGITSVASNNNRNVFTIVVNTTDEVYFTVRTDVNQNQNTTTYTLQGAGFNTSANLNSN